MQFSPGLRVVKSDQAVCTASAREVHIFISQQDMTLPVSDGDRQMAPQSYGNRFLLLRKLLCRSAAAQKLRERTRSKWRAACRNLRNEPTQFQQSGVLGTRPIRLLRARTTRLQLRKCDFPTAR